MTALVAAQVHRLLPRTGDAHVVLGEVPAAQGIADVVAVRFDAAAVRHRLNLGVGPLCSPLRVRMLDLLRPDRGMRIATLARKLGSNPRALTRSTLGPLTDMGLIEVSDGLVRSSGAWRPAGTQLTAVELKLSKWRDALRQADNFALSADRTWVVLDETRSCAAVAATGYFRQLGIGLALLAPTGRLRTVVSPRGRRPRRWLRALMAERAWAAAEPEVAALAA
ncbi:MAG: hypothetical protein ACRDNS_23265 [Trebonia sp.]